MIDLLEHLKLYIKTTWVFFLVRLVASALVGLVYILIAAAIQYFFVELFGETTFNYIVGGVLSLYLGAVACTYFGRLLFMFIRGWHMGAVAFAQQIDSKKLPALEVGMHVFKKHFGTFALVYGASVLIKKFSSKGAKELWSLLHDVPYLCSLERVANFPFVVKMGEDILDTAFDAVIYYLVKYTKPGISDDLSAFPAAIKRYLYALPQVMLSSLWLYFILTVIPAIIRGFIVVYLIMSNGLVGGILLNVLAYPVFYIIKHSIFEPLETLTLIACYAKRCTGEVQEGAVSSTIVDSIISLAGLDEFFAEGAASEEEGSHEQGNDEMVQQSTADVDGLTDDEVVVDVDPVFEPEARVDVLTSEHRNEIPDISSLPIVDEDDLVLSASAEEEPASLFSMIKNKSDDMPEDVEEEPVVPPVVRIGSLINRLSPDMINQAWNSMSSVQSSDDDNDSGDTDSSGMGGDDFDFR